MTDSLYNQYYLDFPQFEHDERFGFPDILSRVEYKPNDNLHRNTAQPPIVLYRFQRDLEPLPMVTGPTEYDLTGLYLGLDDSPESLSTGLHRCVLYFSSDGERGLLAVGRGTLLVITKWKNSE